MKNFLFVLKINRKEYFLFILSFAICLIPIFLNINSLSEILLMLSIIPILFLILLKPYFGIISMAALLPFLSSSANVSMPEIVFSSLFVFILFISLIKGIFRKSKIFKSSFLILAFFFILTILLSFIPAISNNVSGIFYIRRAFPFFLFLLLIPVFIEMESDGKAFKYILFTISAISLFNIFKIISDWYHNLGVIGGIVNLEQVRIAGNGIYLISLPIIVMAMLTSNKKRGIHNIILQILLFVSISALILSYTRSYWIGFLSSIIFLVIFLNNVDKNKIFKIIVIQSMIFALIFLILLKFQPIFSDKILSWVKARILSFENLSSLLSVRGRLDEIKSILVVFPKSPIWGFGLGSTYDYYSISPFAWGGIGYKQLFYSHNFYAYHLYATGIIGLTAFLVFITKPILISISTYKRYIENNIITIYLAAIIFGLLFTSLTSPQFVDMPSNFYIGIFIGIILYNYKYGKLKINKI